MFFYQSDRLSVVAASRCGHTSMYRYFGIEPYSSEYTPFEQFKDNKSPVKVIVIRNPYDRLLSAVRNLESQEKNNVQLVGITRKQHIWEHSNHYIHQLHTWGDVGYKIIDFYNLGLYIPVGQTTLPTYSNDGITEWQDWMSEWMNKQEMLKEFSAYQEIIKNRPRLSTGEWFKFTGDLELVAKNLDHPKNSQTFESSLKQLQSRVFEAANRNSAEIGSLKQRVADLELQIKQLIKK